MAAVARDADRILRTVGGELERVTQGVIPVDVRRLAYHFEVRDIAAHALAIDGYLGRHKDGGFVIRYSVDSSPRRVRFTIAHEIAHILIARAQGKKLDCPMQRAVARNQYEELLANKIAASLLMPECSLQKQISRRDSGWKSVFALAGEYDVSVSAMVSRLFELKETIALLLQIPGDHLRNLDVARSCWRSSYHSEVSFFQRPQNLIGRVLSKVLDGFQPSVDICISGRSCALSLDIRRMNSKEYWFLGWIERADLF